MASAIRRIGLLAALFAAALAAPCTGAPLPGPFLEERGLAAPTRVRVCNHLPRLPSGLQPPLAVAHRFGPAPAPMEMEVPAKPGDPLELREPRLLQPGECASYSGSRGSPSYDVDLLLYLPDEASGTWTPAYWIVASNPTIGTPKFGASLDCWPATSTYSVGGEGWADSERGVWAARRADADGHKQFEVSVRKVVQGRFRWQEWCRGYVPNPLVVNAFV
ncbi:hypothetical protein DFJ74DRAFT_745971 [Hyaloraphidium curvatum]|nr:hypothetical protein DFJ74DRAFT_745971 [Hyaloraphidium curvatum]